MGIVWIRVEEMSVYDRMKYLLCTAERHEGKGIRSDWVIAMEGPALKEVGYPDGKIIYGICNDCLTEIARDLGTTPEAESEFRINV